MMSFISVMFAFLVMAHFIGAKLSRIQVGIASALFIWASFAMIYAMAGYFYRALMFVDRLRALDPELSFFFSPVTPIIIALMMLIGVFVCLFFLLQSRRSLTTARD